MPLEGTPIRCCGCADRRQVIGGCCTRNGSRIGQHSISLYIRGRQLRYVAVRNECINMCLELGQCVCHSVKNGRKYQDRIGCRYAFSTECEDGSKPFNRVNLFWSYWFTLKGAIKRRAYRFQQGPYSMCTDSVYPLAHAYDSLSSMGRERLVRTGVSPSPCALQRITQYPYCRYPYS